MKFSFALAALLPIVVSAVDIPVAVGQNGLTFEPSSVDANEGDIIVFTFYPKNHTVTRSTFDNPCTTYSDTDDDGDDDSDDDDIVADSGFVPVESPEATQTWNYTVTDSDDAVWFYCAQTSPVNHCTSGMVFALNPTEERTFEAFQENARNADPETSPSPTTTGGTGPTATTTGGTSPTNTDTTDGASPTNTDTTGGNTGGNGASTIMVSTGAAAFVLAGALFGAAL